MNLIDNSVFTIMKNSMDALWLRQQTISSNIANMDTPGYKSVKVDFEDILSNKIESINENLNPKEQAENLVSINPEVVQDESTEPDEYGNNVDINAQNIELSRTQIEYEYMSRMISNEISRLKYAISEGRK